MKIGLFGGSFDPIHKGHLHVAQAFGDELALDSVIFLPAGNPYHKNSTRTAAQHRLNMVQLAIANEAQLAVSDVDLRSGATYTIDTIEIFRQHFPSDDLYFLLGMDSLMQLPTWKNWQKLVQKTKIAVAARSGETLANAPEALRDWLGEALVSGNLKILNAPKYDVSSTEIRHQLANNQQPDALPNGVYEYIKQNHLYE